MLLRITGCINIEIRTALSNILDQIGRMTKYVRRLRALNSISAQSKNRADTRLLKHFQSLIHAVSVQILRSQVSNRFNAVFGANRVRNSCGSSPVSRLARSVGDGNKIRLNALQTVHRVVNRADRSSAFRRKNFKRKCRVAHCSSLICRACLQHFRVMPVRHA